MMMDPTDISAYGCDKRACCLGEWMQWHIENNGFALTLDSRRPARIRPWFRSSADLSAAERDPAQMLWAIHPGGRLILSSVQDACGLADAQRELSCEVLRRFGNMSPASIMFILQDLLQRETGATEPQPGRALAFGPGLTVEMLDFTLHPTRANLRPLSPALASTL